MRCTSFGMIGLILCFGYDIKECFVKEELDQNCTMQPLTHLIVASILSAFSYTIVSLVQSSIV